MTHNTEQLEKEREAFEQHFARVWEVARDAPEFDRCGNGYRIVCTDTAWEAWLARAESDPTPSAPAENTAIVEKMILERGCESDRPGQYWLCDQDVRDIVAAVIAAPNVAAGDGQKVATTLRAYADAEYCNYLDKLRTPNALGWEAKVRAGQFTAENLAAHTEAARMRGKHQAFMEAIGVIEAASAAVQPAAQQDAEKLRDDAVDQIGNAAQGLAFALGMQEIDGDEDEVFLICRFLENLTEDVKRSGTKWHIEDGSITVAAPNVAAGDGVLWMDAAPSETPCGRCGGPVIDFSIPNTIWNLVMRPHGKEGELPEYICLGCWYERLESALTSRQVEVPAAFTKKFQCQRPACAIEFDLTIASTTCPACDSEACAVQPAAQQDVDAVTGNSEADRIINRLNSSDPTFDDCADAAALIYKLVAEHKGPDGFATWKDAAVAERLKRAAPESPKADEVVVKREDAEVAVYYLPEIAVSGRTDSWKAKRAAERISAALFPAATKD